MSSSGPSFSLKTSLLRKPVVVKLPGWSRALPAMVVAIEDSGFWLVGKEIIVALREANGSSMSQMITPRLYVPFSNIEWILASEPQEVAETE